MKQLFKQEPRNELKQRRKHDRAEKHYHFIVLQRQQAYYDYEHAEPVYRTHRAVQKAPVYKMPLSHNVIADLQALSADSVYDKKTEIFIQAVLMDRINKILHYASLLINTFNK